MMKRSKLWLCHLVPLFLRLPAAAVLFKALSCCPLGSGFLTVPREATV